MNAADVASVVAGSALGGLGRYWLSGFIARRIGETFPWGTMGVNVSGAFAIGLIAAAVASPQSWFADPSIWRLSVIGFLGSYTTVSSFSLQTLALARESEWLKALSNIVLSLGLCLSAAAMGLVAGTNLFR